MENSNISAESEPAREQIESSTTDPRSDATRKEGVLSERQVIEQMRGINLEGQTKSYRIKGLAGSHFALDEDHKGKIKLLPHKVLSLN
jgi:hypothetical protein